MLCDAWHLGWHTLLLNTKENQRNGKAKSTNFVRSKNKKLGMVSFSKNVPL